MNHVPLHRKPIAIASAVVLLHVGGLAALQSGLLVRAYEIVVPVQVISQIIEPPKPEIAPPPPPAPSAPPVPPPPSPAPLKKMTSPPAPQPLAISDPTPSPNSPQVAPTPPAPLPPINAPVAATPAPPAQPAAPPTPPVPEKITEPELAAEHQANEELFRPPVASKRLREFGTVLLSVTVGADGRAKNAVVAKSSGYARLDEAAVRGAMLARFKPATRGGIAIERKFSWPIIYPEPAS